MQMHFCYVFTSLRFIIMVVAVYFDFQRDLLAWPKERGSGGGVDWVLIRIPPVMPFLS